MTDSPHQLLRRIFDDAMALPPQQRATFVARECGTDTNLRDRIVRLLDAGEHEHFLATPEQAHVARPTLPAGEGVGSTIGPYTLVRELGEGGFGVVFLAEQTQPVARQVALKVLKPGMDSRQIVARFEQEQQTLARLEHPHIARVIDAGATTAGRPFFVMEFVDGLPLVDHCDRHRLSVAQRLELFVQVCDAVQHAHGRGVLHRDLKPSNVLVAEPDGQPFCKVIDFGIAKAIHGRAAERTALTEGQTVLGTLLYMSPEQADGAQDLDVRTDVYSLGAMLYELLTGSAPLDAATLQGTWHAELHRRIREVDPPPPSRRITTSGARIEELAARRQTSGQRLGTRVRGELDWIVMKAIEKDRGRRYPTAHAFAEDLRRHLAGDLVSAAPPSASYRARKFVRNHRWQVAAAVALLLSLLGGAAAFAWQADIARTERDDADASRRAEAAQRRLADERAVAAQTARDQAETMTRFVVEALESSDPYRGGREGMSVRDAMAKAVQRLDAGALRQLPGTEVELRTRIAAILYNNSGAEQAVPVAHRAVELARQSGPDQAEALVGALGIHAVALGRSGKAGEAAPLLAEALQLQRRRVPGDDSFTVLLLGTLTRSHLDQGRIPAAEPLATEALAMAERLWPGDSFEVANVLSLRADVLKEMGRLPEAEQLAAAGYAMHRRLFDGDHPDIGSALASLANAELLQGKLEPATQHYEELLAMYRRLFAVPGAQHAVAVHNLGVAYWSAGQAARAEPLFQEALELHRKVFPSDHPATARNLKNLGSAWRVLGKKADAERVLLESVAMWDRLFPDGHPEYADCRIGLAVLHRELGQLDNALRGAESAVAMRRTTLGPDHPELARALYLVGELHAQRNAAALAVSPYRESLAILQRAHGDAHAEVVTLHMRLADALLGSAQPAAALPHYQAAIEVQTRLGKGEANVAYCWSGLARSRQESGDTVGARAAFDEANARLAQVAPNGSINRARTLWRSGAARLAAGDAAAALPELEGALAMGTKVLPANHAHLTDYRASVEACKAALAR
jgi:eukaryotic-like serine/threonine-protein kinase